MDGARQRRGIYLIKHNMARDNDTVGREIKTVVSLTVRRVSKEDTPSGTRCKFVGSNRKKVEIAGATKNTEVFVGQGSTKQGKMGVGGADGLCGEKIQQVCHIFGGFQPSSVLEQKLGKLESK